jgi:putative DNA methylase
MARSKGPSKKDVLTEQVARAVGAGREMAMETVDFNDPNRPLTCLEVDFPILPINEVADIEGNAGKPIYQMSKWWARRRSSVFRSLLLSAAMKAPEDPTKAAKAVWDVYYANHQAKGAFNHLKVADIFMGGGTTLVEGSRLGMQMTGVDLNPVAWFVVKNEFAKVTKEEVESLLADIEAEVKPQLMPFYACNGPRGEKGKWVELSTGKVMGEEFDPFSVAPEERKHFRYDGPEIIYTFWAKHGPCLSCGHRTPIMSSPVVAIKTLTVKAYTDHRCPHCQFLFDIEEREARMAPDADLVISPEEKPFALLKRNGVICPSCNQNMFPPTSRKPTNKKVELTLMVCQEWLKGTPAVSASGETYGGSATDSPQDSARWFVERARSLRLIEYRGKVSCQRKDDKTGQLRFKPDGTPDIERVLPEQIIDPVTKKAFFTDSRGGNIPKRSSFTCQAPTCGRENDVLTAIKASGKTGPMAPYATQAYSPNADKAGTSYGGRYFSIPDHKRLDSAWHEWELNKDTTLAGYWPREELAYGFMTHMNNGGIPNHGFTHWWKMFNHLQLLGNALLLKAIVESGAHSWETREFVLGGFQQYVRNQNMFCIWDISRDCLAPMLSNNNYHPKATPVENCVFATLGRGNWQSSGKAILEGLAWAENPWELVSSKRVALSSGEADTFKSTKVEPGDPVCPVSVICGSSSELGVIQDSSLDLVITDPPFSGLLHYSELADFFYVWLSLVLKAKYPREFSTNLSPKTLEAVANRARNPEDADAYYRRILTECWAEAHRVLKASGLLAFTFHHKDDEPWVDVLGSLFDAGFYLEATYPIRSDETKGEGAKPGTFGSQTIEFDIIHVCRKRIAEPQPISWAKMRREVLREVNQLRTILESHRAEGLPDADLNVIRRGKALEYYSRHYGQVFVDDDRAITLKEALVGINLLLEEDGERAKDPLPVHAEPLTRQLLRIFQGTTSRDRGEMQKYMRGTGSAPDEFLKLGWCLEKNKVYHLESPLDIAKVWKGKQRARMTSDYEQAMVLIGACYADSGISAEGTLNNENFRAHPGLKGLLEWHATQGGNSDIRNAANRAMTLYRTWEASNRDKVAQMSLFAEEA